MKNFNVTVISFLYMGLTLISAGLALSYGVTYLFHEMGYSLSIWFSVVKLLFSYMFPDMIIFIVIVFLGALGSTWISLQLLKRKKWARIFFICFSAILMPWGVYRLINAFINMPTFVSFSAIIGSNPLTKYPSIIYFMFPVVLILLEVLFVYTLTTLLKSEVKQEFI
ncbi:MAG: hypothetical protein PF637_02905 [Spirochaetes bacterium]|nr:hypothetical protein [Spirochaetota bacterium]